MHRPKYQIGDTFKVTKKVRHEDLNYEGTFEFYVLSVVVESTDKGYAYKYGLGPRFPQAYFDAPVNMWEFEETLSKREQLEGYFGQG